MSALLIKKELKKFGSTEKAKSSERFFKTGKGQYGEGDLFWGITLPEQRTIAKKYYKETTLLEVQNLLKDKVHECRLTGLIILVEKYKTASKEKDIKVQKQIFDFYIKNTKYVNNWDLVDGSASYIVGEYLLSKNRDALYTLARSKNLWERRIAIVATHTFIKNSDFKDTLKISEILMTDTHDLIHKAIGWMLREVGKKDKKTLVDFLDKYKNKLPRTTLRYSIEHFNEKERKLFLGK